MLTARAAGGLLSPRSGMKQETVISANQIKNLIDKLISKAETGEQWAEICDLEVQMIEAQKREANEAA